MAGEHDRSPAGLVPFWAHQLAEMLLGGLLLVEGARTGEHTAVLVGMGSLLLLLALMSDGALGAWPWIGRRLHRVLDLVAAAALAVSPLVLSLDAVLPVVILEVAALGMLWLALRTNWTVRARRSARTRPAAPRPLPRPPRPRPHRALPRRPHLRRPHPHRRSPASWGRWRARPATTAPANSGAPWAASAGRREAPVGPQHRPRQRTRRPVPRRTRHRPPTPAEAAALRLLVAVGLVWTAGVGGSVS